MTERLYYNDPSLLTFDAKVLESGRDGNRAYVVLDRSAFYPASGGQPHDTGLINGVRVIEVIEDESGDVRHIIEKEISDIKIHGVIDSERRHYFRQLHTAQHIISRAFINLFDYETVSVHLGEEYGAVELSAANISTEQSAQAEKLANEIIEQNQRIEIIFADENEIKSLPLRKTPERTGIIRIIKIGELDWSACGGTHCHATSEVGIIKIIGVEKQRGHALVKFLAGAKAVKDYFQRFEITDKLTKQLTCAVIDLSDKIEKLTIENKDLKKQLSQLQLELLPAKAAGLAKSAEKVGKINCVVQTVDGIDSKQLNQLAAETARQINGLAALIFENRLCLAAADNLELDSGKIVKQLADKFMLKGGGNKSLAQLGGVTDDKIGEIRQQLLAIIHD